MVFTEEHKTSLSNKDSFELAKEKIDLNVSDKRYKLKLNKILNELILFRTGVIEVNNDTFDIELKFSSNNSSCHYNLLFTIFNANSPSLGAIIIPYLIIKDEMAIADSLIAGHDIKRESYSNLLHALISGKENSLSIKATENDLRYKHLKIYSDIIGQSFQTEQEWANKLYIEFDVTKSLNPPPKS